MRGFEWLRMRRPAGVLRLFSRPSGRTAIALAAAVGAVAVPSLISAADESAVSQAALATPLQVAVRVVPPEPPPPPPPPDPVLSTNVQAVLDMSNAERTARGIAPLEFHFDLAEAAAIHGNDQRNQPCATGYLTHTGSDGSSPGDRIRRTGLTVSNWAENIACGYSTPGAVMNGWMNSAGHRANILNPALTHIGISITYSDSGRAYWVQDFGVPRT